MSGVKLPTGLIWPLVSMSALPPGPPLAAGVQGARSSGLDLEGLPWL